MAISSAEVLISGFSAANRTILVTDGKTWIAANHDDFRWVSGTNPERAGAAALAAPVAAAASAGARDRFLETLPHL